VQDEATSGCGSSLAGSLAGAWPRPAPPCGTGGSSSNIRGFAPNRAGTSIAPRSLATDWRGTTSNGAHLMNKLFLGVAAVSVIGGLGNVALAGRCTDLNIYVANDFTLADVPVQIRVVDFDYSAATTGCSASR
jgi:hypothetical protein